MDNQSGRSYRTDSVGGTRPDTSSRSRRRFLVGAGAGAVTALTGCLGSSSPRTGNGTKTPNPEVDFRLHWNRRNNIYANFTAAEEWTWPDHGVDVTVKSSNGSQAAAKSVAGKEEQFGSGGYGAVLQLVGSGAPLTVLGTFTGPWGGVVSLDKTGITSWSDLEGAVVGRFPFGSTGPVAEAAMQRKGVDVSTVQFRNVQPGSGLPLLMEEKIDAMIRYVPQTRARLELQGFEVNALKSGDVLDHLGLAVFAHDNVVENEPDLVDSFVAGWIDGIKLWTEQHDKVIREQETLVDEESWQPKLNERMLGAVYAAQAPPKPIGTEHGLGWVSEDRLERTIDVFHGAGVMDEKVPPEDVYTNEFVEGNQRLATDTATALYDRLEAFDVSPDYL